MEFFTPGLLRAEIFVTKVREAIEAARFDGNSFGALLIDGVHNLIMQFPLLQDEPLLWPLLVQTFAPGADADRFHLHVLVQSG